eukprot:1139454-Pelagomonas_calceolata.AAC.6
MHTRLWKVRPDSTSHLQADQACQLSYGGAMHHHTVLALAGLAACARVRPRLRAAPPPTSGTAAIAGSLRRCSNSSSWKRGGVLLIAHGWPPA